MSRLLQGYLGSGDTLSRLQAHAARLRRLEATLHAALPPALVAACSVGNLKGDTLVLLARNGATAARVKQFLPTLIQQFADTGTLLRKIDLRVMMQPAPAAPPPSAVRTLSTASLESLARFSASLPEDAPLKASVERLIRRSRADE